MEDSPRAVAQCPDLDVSRPRSGHVPPGADHRGDRRRGRVDAPLESPGDGGRSPTRGRGLARLRRRPGGVLAHVEAVAAGGPETIRLRPASPTMIDVVTR